MYGTSDPNVRKIHPAVGTRTARDRQSGTPEDSAASVSRDASWSSLSSRRRRHPGASSYLNEPDLARVQTPVGVFQLLDCPGLSNSRLPRSGGSPELSTLEIRHPIQAAVVTGGRPRCKSTSTQRTLLRVL